MLMSLSFVLWDNLHSSGEREFRLNFKIRFLNDNGLVNIGWKSEAIRHAPVRYISLLMFFCVFKNY